MTPSALAHRFGPDLTCACGTTHRDHQTTQLRCTIKKRPEVRQRTHCPYGHEYTAANTLYTDKKYKACRTCRNDRDRKRRADKKLEQQGGE